jgi:hypothetical protein
MKLGFMRAAIRLSLSKMRRNCGGPFGAADFAPQNFDETTALHRSAGSFCGVENQAGQNRLLIKVLSLPRAGTFSIA